jgi:hypothetical protein
MAGVVDAAKLNEAALPLPDFRALDRLIHHDVRLPANERPALPVAQHARLALDIGRVVVAEVAEELVGGAVGEHDHVARLPAAVGEAIHAVDKGEHPDEQGDDDGERRRGEQRDRPAHHQVAQVVADRHLAHRRENEDQDREPGQRREQLGRNDGRKLEIHVIGANNDECLMTNDETMTKSEIPKVFRYFFLIHARLIWLA